MNATVQLFFETLSQKFPDYKKHLNLLFLFLLFLQFPAHSQNVDLRNLTLNSDVILFVEMVDYEYSTQFVNDHFSKTYIKIKNYPKILKNNTDIKFINKEIYCPKESNDFYDNAKIAGGGCIGIGEPTEPNKKYYSILFLRKDKKQLILLAHFSRSNYEW